MSPNLMNSLEMWSFEMMVLPNPKLETSVLSIWLVLLYPVLLLDTLDFFFFLLYFIFTNIMLWIFSAWIQQKLFGWSLLVSVELWGKQCLSSSFRILVGKPHPFNSTWVSSTHLLNVLFLFLQHSGIKWTRSWSPLGSTFSSACRFSNGPYWGHIGWNSDDTNKQYLGLCV